MKWDPTIGIDDLGDNLSGQSVNRAYIEHIRDTLNLILHSENNPTVSVKAIIDQVRAAAGNLSDVNTRIGNVVDANGNPIVGAGVMSTVRFQESMGLLNYMRNPSLLIWADEAANAPPTGYNFAGTGASCTRCGEGEGDTNRWIGKKCAKLTDVGTGDTHLQQVLLDAAAYPYAHNALKARYCSLIAAVKTGSTSLCRLLIGDGADASVGNFHTGSGDWELLSVTHKISTAATQIYSRARVVKAGDAYVDGFAFVFTEDAPTFWVPPPAVIYGSLSFAFPGLFIVGDNQGTYIFQRPAIFKNITAHPGTPHDPTPVAPSGDVDITIEKYSSVGPAWVNLFTGNKTILTNGVSYGHVQPDGAWCKRCFGGGSGLIGAVEDAAMRFNIKVQNACEGETFDLHFAQFVNPFEDFMAFDDHL